MPPDAGWRRDAHTTHERALVTGSVLRLHDCCLARAPPRACLPTLPRRACRLLAALAALCSLAIVVAEATIAGALPNLSVVSAALHATSGEGRALAEGSGRERRQRAGLMEGLRAGRRRNPCGRLSTLSGRAALPALRPWRLPFTTARARPRCLAAGAA